MEGLNGNRLKSLIKISGSSSGGSSVNWVEGVSGQLDSSEVDSVFRLLNESEYS